ncbi:hypothetical protein JOF56_007070 [Kibdelosporangium banguiense]|uniref:Uncharacterized protein n=1 Tax=Kibdelosporangium banguiense TaxID=1365924 RepID=A0ABS4TQJ8_9PSEU|nr:hypothetical protein [Kibdelosporangium banguiense]
MSAVQSRLFVPHTLLAWLGKTAGGQNWPGGAY